MKSILTGILAAALLGAGFWATSLAQEQRDRHARRLPGPVTNTLHRLYPNAELHDVDDDDEDAQRNYKLEVRLPGKAGEAWLKVMADGTLMESREERRIELAPEAVRHALARAFPKGRITEARVVTRTMVTYEVDLRDGDRRREVTLSPRGKILEVERQ